MSEIKIRQLNLEDAEAYREIRLRMLKENSESFGDSYEDNLSYGLSFFEGRIANSPIFGAFDNENLVATAGYFIHQGQKIDHKATIWGVYVSPEQRGNRVSQNLVEQAVKACVGKVEQVLINVSGENIAALKIYQDIGFEEFGREPKARKIKGQYYDEISMVKFLEK